MENNNIIISDYSEHPIPTVSNNLLFRHEMIQETPIHSCIRNSTLIFCTIILCCGFLYFIYWISNMYFKNI